MRRRILDKIESYADDASSQANNVKSLTGDSGYRLRVGDDRVLFTLEDASVTVMLVRRIRHRRDAYGR